jgi:hypothetical protein
MDSSNNREPKSSGGPFSCYLFNADGKYDPTTVPVFQDVQLAIKWLSDRLVFIKSGLEIMVTDRDDFAVFHAKDGKIVYPVTTITNTERK